MTSADLHFRLLQRVGRAACAAGRVCVPLDIRCGGELGHDVVGSLSKYELDLLAQGPPEARWLLVEAPFDQIDTGFHAATDELRERGFGVVIAHPERSADAALDAARGLRRELEAGSLAQVNAQSLTGGHREEARVAAWRLLREGLVAVIASDAHGPTRPPALSGARGALLAAGMRLASADLLVKVGPWRALQSGIRPRTVVAA